MTLAATRPAVDTAPAPARTNADGEYQQLMSDLLHDLSQPLSTLTCLLEVNLLLSRPLKQVRHDLKIALQQVHWIVRLFRGLRELAEAAGSHQGRARVGLTDCLREAVADRPPTAGPGVKLSVSSSSDCVVNFEASRLRQGLVHLLEFAVGSAVAGAEVSITTAEDSEGVRRTSAVSAAAVPPAEPAPDDRAAGTAESQERKQREWKRRLDFAIARRIFEVAGGSLRSENHAERLSFEVRLRPVG
jgi:signal transduction histidine kinase